MNKKAVSILLAMSVVVSLGACVETTSGGGTSDSSASAQNSTSETGGESKGVIGYNYFASGDYALDTLANNTKHAIESCGYTAQSVCNNGSLDQLVTDVENMIASGVDGLVLWIPNDSLYETVAQICEDAQVPFTLSDKVPTDKAIIERLEENYTMYKGGVTPDNYSYGVQMAEFALDQGYETAFILASGIGDASGTPRIEGFRDVFEEAGGTVLGEQHTDDSNQAVTQAEDMYLANPDADCIMATGASTFGTAALETLRKYDDHNMKIITADFDQTILQSMKEEDYVDFLIGDFLVSGTYSSVLLINALEGTPMTDVDGSAPLVDMVPAFPIPVEQQDLFTKYIAEDNIYMADEIQAMLGMSLEDFEENVVKTYSLESRLQAKYDAGMISDEEMSAAGLK